MNCSHYELFQPIDFLFYNSRYLKKVFIVINLFSRYSINILLLFQRTLIMCVCYVYVELNFKRKKITLFKKKGLNKAQYI